MIEITLAATRRRGRPRLFFDQIPQTLSRDPDICHGAKSLYGLLHGYCPRKRLSNNPTCFPSRETLAKAMGVSVDRIEAYAKGLRKKGWITWKRRGRAHSNEYTLYPKPTFEQKATRKPNFPRPLICDVFDRDDDPFNRERVRREMAAIYGDRGSKITEEELTAFLGPAPEIEDLPWEDTREWVQDLPIFRDSAA